MNLFDNMLCHVLLCLAFIVLYGMSYTKGRVINRNQTRIKRIVGGVEVEYGYSPYLVFILSEVPSNYFWGIYWGTKKSSCGASLVHRQWLLTAAHCLMKDNEIVSPIYWQAKLGDITSPGTYTSFVKGLLSRFFTKPEWAEYFVRVKGIFLHPAYSESYYFKSDIALMKLATPVNIHLPLDKGDSIVDALINYHPKIKTATNIAPKRIGLISLLPSMYSNLTVNQPTECILKGWGCRSWDGSVTSNLAHEINMTVVTEGYCDFHWGGVSETRVCALATKQAEGACPGDSGSPLTCLINNNNYYQIGVTSFKSSINNMDIPIVFTRVSKFLSWIDFTVKNE